MYYPQQGGGRNWAAIIAGLAALGIGSYVVYWMWQNGYFGDGGCKTSADCATGYTCVLGKCTKDTGCKTNADCPTGYVCNAEKKCVPNQGCTSDANCPTGQHCNPATHLCVQCLDKTHCPTGYKCVNNICVPDKPETFDVIGNSVWTIEIGGAQIPQGPLRGVAIKAKNLDTNQIWEATSDANGDWGPLVGVPEGFYEITATKTGYNQIGRYPYVEWSRNTGYWPGLEANVRTMYSTMEYYYSTSIDVSVSNDYYFSISPAQKINHIAGSIRTDCGFGCLEEHSFIYVVPEGGHEPNWEYEVWHGTGGGVKTFDVNFSTIKAEKVVFWNDCFYLLWQGKGLKDVTATIERVFVP